MTDTTGILAEMARISKSLKPDNARLIEMLGAIAVSRQATIMPLPNVFPDGKTVIMLPQELYDELIEKYGVKP